MKKGLKTLIIILILLLLLSLFINMFDKGNMSNIDNDNELIISLSESFIIF